MRNRQFQDLLTKVEHNLKAKMGKDYCGLISIADEITGLYLKKQHYENECEYIQSLRHYLFSLDFLDWLSTNYFQFTHTFDFRRVLSKIEPEVYEVKRKIFYKWLSGETEKEIIEFEKIDYKTFHNKLNEKKLTFLDRLYLELIKEYSKEYQKTTLPKLKEFKKELGL